MVKPASDKYNLTISPGLYHVHGFGEIDLAHLTLNEADRLYKKGFPYLALRPKSDKPAPAPKTKPVRKKKNKK